MAGAVKTTTPDKTSLPEWILEGNVQRLSAPGLSEDLWGIRGAKGVDSCLRLRQTLPSHTPAAATVAGVVRAAKVGPLDEDAAGVAFLRIHILDSKGRILKSKEPLEWSGSFGWTPWTDWISIPPQGKQLEVIAGMKEALGRTFFRSLEILWGFPEDQDRRNLLADGGFEYAGALSGWQYGKDHRVVFPGFQGRAAIRIKHSDFQTSFVEQDFVLPAGAGPMALKFYARMNNGQSDGESKGGGAAGRIEFFDSQGERVQALRFWGPWRGTFEWKKFSCKIKAPENAVRAKLRLGLEQAKGWVWFDGVRMEAGSSEGPISLRPLESRTDTTGWKKFRPLRGPLSGVLDMSRLLDPPAGRHGFLQVREGRFVFEDGTPVRFLGANI